MRPKADVRRYDVFAAWNYLEQKADGKAEAEAKRHGVWLATVVAARKFRRQAARPQREEAEAKRTDYLGLTAADYDARVRDRMGRTFHDRVFLPALRAARKNGKGYMDVRDSIRSGWKAQ